MDKATKVAVAAINRTPMWVLLFLVIVFSIYPEMDEWEGRQFPVATKLIFESVETLGSGHTQITVAFNKLRSCKFLGLAYYVKDDDGAQIRVPISTPLVRPGIDNNRSRGLNRYTVIVETQVPVERWRVTVRHDCHPLWETLTVMHP